MKAMVCVSLEISVEIESEGSSWGDVEQKVRNDLYANPSKYVQMLADAAAEAELSDFEVYGTREI